MRCAILPRYELTVLGTLLDASMGKDNESNNVLDACFRLKDIGQTAHSAQLVGFFQPLPCPAQH
jgi:hypothetical protein